MTFNLSGVILEDVELSLTTASDQYVTEKRNNVNDLLVDVSLIFDEESANFDNGIDFWDLDFYLAGDDVGHDRLVDATNSMYIIMYSLPTCTFGQVSKVIGPRPLLQ